MDYSQILLSELQDVDYFLLRHYYVLKELMDDIDPQSKEESTGFYIVKARITRMYAQRHVLTATMRLMEQGKQLSESRQQIVSKLGIITQILRTSIGDPPRDRRLVLDGLNGLILVDRDVGMQRPEDVMLGPDENRVKEYLNNIDELIEAYEPVFREIERFLVFYY